jgi:hypothetical protein
VSIQSGAISPKELDAMTRVLRSAAEQLGIAAESTEFAKLATKLIELSSPPINEGELLQMLVRSHADKRKAI